MRYPKKRDLKKNPPKPHKTSFPPTETVQDDAMSISEIFSRYNSAMPEPKHPYFDNEDLDQLAKFHRQDLDLTDLEDLQKKTANMKTDIENKIQNAKNAQSEASNDDGDVSTDSGNDITSSDNSN